jgi:hypothetical protein
VEQPGHRRDRDAIACSNQGHCQIEGGCGGLGGFLRDQEKPPHFGGPRFFRINNALRVDHLLRGYFAAGHFRISEQVRAFGQGDSKRVEPDGFFALAGWDPVGGRENQIGLFANQLGLGESDWYLRYFCALQSKSADKLGRYPVANHG